MDTATESGRARDATSISTTAGPTLGDQTTSSASITAAAAQSQQQQRYLKVKFTFNTCLHTPEGVADRMVREHVIPAALRDAAVVNITYTLLKAQIRTLESIRGSEGDNAGKRLERQYQQMLRRDPEYLAVVRREMDVVRELHKLRDDQYSRLQKQRREMDAKTQKEETRYFNEMSRIEIMRGKWSRSQRERYVVILEVEPYFQDDSGSVLLRPLSSCLSTRFCIALNIFLNTCTSAARMLEIELSWIKRRRELGIVSPGEERIKVRSSPPHANRGSTLLLI